MIDQQALNIAWILVCAALVMLMQGGFCCLEAGLVRAKNSINVAMKNLVDLVLSGGAFWLVGFGLMFGHSIGGWFGVSHVPFSGDDTPWLYAFFVFQFVFCATATTIVSGAVAERMSFRTYVLLSLLISGLVYPLFGHWAWCDASEVSPAGWLKQIGFIDFAGSTVVHSIGAWSALAAVIVIGPRLGRFGPGARHINGHNLPLSVLGVLMLWVGWIGFNGGSTLALDSSIAKIVANTNVAAVFGGITALFLSWRFDRRPGIEHTINGVIAGLVAITASCHLVSLPAAALIGMVGGLICRLSGWALDRLKIDDAIGAFPAHGLTGVWGTLAVALFANADSFTADVTRWHQLGVQATGVAVAACWGFGVCYTGLRLANLFFPLRVTEEQERQGLNVAEHNANTELITLLTEMRQHQIDGDLSRVVAVEPNTEVGQIATEYNRVISSIQTEMEKRSQAEAKFRGIFENAVEGIFQSLPEGRYVDANPALARLYGYDSREELLQGMNDIGTQLYVDPQRRTEFCEQIARDGIVTNFESEVWRRDGSTIWISENTRAVYDEQGTIVQYEGTVEDITERKQLDEALRRKQAAEAASIAKSQFLANMSHEIRTPLNAILGFTNIMMSGERAPEEQREYLELIHKSGRHLLALINDILDLSKIEAGRMEFEKTRCSPQEVISSVLSPLRVQAQEKGLVLECRWESGVPETIDTDPTRLRQLLTNLVGNALKFTSKGGVEVVASVEPGGPEPRLTLRVVDTGVGIPAQKLEEIFHPFSQADSSVTREYGGTGLGLTISRQIAEGLGGTLSVESEIGSGSVFQATIATGELSGVPIHTYAPSEAFRGGTTTAPRPTYDLTGCRILVVDDGATNRKLIELLLSEVGADVRCAENGMEGSQLALDNTFDLILMDMQMPVMDGYTAARRLRHANYFRPIVAITAHAMKEDRDKCLEAGCTDYVSKPVDRDELLEVIGRLLNRGPKSKGIRPEEATIEDSPAVAIAPVLEPIVSTLPIEKQAYREIVEEFVERLAEQLEQIESSLAQEDLEQVRKLAHWLKGAGGSVGFAAFTEPSRKLEEAAREGELKQAAKAFATIRNIASRLQPAMPSLIKSGE